MTRARRAPAGRSAHATDWTTRRYERTLRRATTDALPRPAGYKVWSWISTERACDGCGDAVAATEIEYDVEVEGTVVLRLHPECFRAWCDARSGA